MVRLSPWRELVLPITDTTFVGIQFIDTLTGWVWGNSRNIIRTTDGGNNWSAVELAPPGELMKVKFVDRNNGWAITQVDQYPTYSHRLWISWDGGSSWTRTNSAADSSSLILDKQFDSVSDSVAFLLFMGDLWQTTNRGTSWNTLSDTSFVLTGSGIAFVSEDFGFISGRGPGAGTCGCYIAHTSDGGLSWSIAYEFLFPDGCVWNLSTTLPTRIFIRYEYCRPCEPPPTPVCGSGIAINLNQRQEWLHFSDSLPFTYLKGDALDSNHVWLLKESGILKRTTNGGASWESDTLPVPMRDFSLVSRNRAWALSQCGRVFVFDSTLLSVDNKYWNIPTHFSLSQNYPNPFNPTTTIRYEIPHAAHVKLTVYSTLGEQVMLLVDQKQDAGDHTVKFDATGLPTGMYFYRLQAGGNTLTKKLMLLK